jgi:hypothetical protein
MNVDSYRDYLMIFKVGVGVFGSKLKPTEQGALEVVVDDPAALWRIGTATPHRTDDGRLVYKIVFDVPEDAPRLDIPHEAEFVLENGEFKRIPDDKPKQLD